MASTRTNVLASVLFTLFGGPALVLLYLPWTITRFHLPTEEPLSQRIFAGVTIAGGLIPLIESIVRFVVVGRGSLVPTVPTEHLVVSGLYRFVRNPMYVGVLTVIAGEALLFHSQHLLVYLGIIWLIIHCFVLFYEEPKLARTYPAEYPRYRANVRRWIPRLTPWADSVPSK